MEPNYLVRITIEVQCEIVIVPIFGKKTCHYNNEEARLKQGESTYINHRVVRLYFIHYTNISGNYNIIMNYNIKEYNYICISCLVNCREDSEKVTISFPYNTIQ